jgi:hypothetical protein
MDQIHLYTRDETFTASIAKKKMGKIVFYKYFKSEIYFQIKSPNK